ncbi:Response regulator [Gammaproteobacteria bacterium]
MSNSKTILVVDDSKVSRMMIRAFILEKYPDWIIEEAATGEEALEKIRTIVPDLISMDVNMPGMGGLAAAGKLREECPFAHISLLTANVQEATRQKAKLLDVGFIEKPITRPRIQKMIEVLVGA